MTLLFYMKLIENAYQVFQGQSAKLFGETLKTGMAMTMAWAHFDLPLGPGAQVHYTPPGALAGE